MTCTNRCIFISLLVLPKLLRQLVKLLQLSIVDGFIVRLLRPGCIIAVLLLQLFHLLDVFLLCVLGA
jgi:hypothetical protein